MSELPHRFGIRRAAESRERRVRRAALPESNRFFFKPRLMAPPDRATLQVIDTVSDPGQRIRRDFAVLPGLALTFGQARRLWGPFQKASPGVVHAPLARR